MYNNQISMASNSIIQNIITNDDITKHLKPLIEKANHLSEVKKNQLNNLICYLHIALRSRYCRSNNMNYFPTGETTQKFQLSIAGIQTVLHSIFNNNVSDNDVNTILSMCTHTKECDSVTSFTETAEKFFKATSLNHDYIFTSLNHDYILEDIKDAFDSNLRIKLKKELFDIFITCIDKNFSKMYLSEADLQEANLQEANLQGANLQRANLQRANLQRANLQRADLRGAYLRQADLRGVNLQDTILQGAILQEANLQGINLRGAGLGGFMLWKANLQGADLQEATLCKADLYGANLQGAHLQGAHLQGAHLQQADLYRANLYGANLQGANLRGANLRGADLRGANLQQVSLHGSNLHRAIFNDKTRIELKFFDILDIDFNHINHDSNSILTAINFIDNTYKTLKISLMLQAINYLDNRDLSTIVSSLEDILYSDQIYIENENIRKFIIERLLHNKIELAKIQAINFKGIELNLLINYIDSLEKNVKNKFILDHNALINQMIYCLIQSNSINMARKLKEVYFELEEIKVINKYYQKNVIYDDLKNYYIFLYTEINSKTFEALMVSEDYITKFLYNNNVHESGLNWNSIVYFKDNQVQLIKKQSLAEIFGIFTVFKANYQFAHNHAKFIELLDLLDLKDYHFYFITVIDKKSHKIPFVTNEHSNALKTIFSQFLTPNNAIELAGETALKVNIKDDHYNKIVEKLDLTNKSSQKKAQALLCLSAVFVKYSSSLFFGTEQSSPISIRYYAFALMNKAIQLDNTIIHDNNNWNNMFLGIGDACTCADSLSRNMLTYCNNTFPDIVNGIVPPAWNV